MVYRGGEDGKGKRLYVGGLPADIQEKEVEDIFFKYGKIVFIDIHKEKFPFCFVEFENNTDALDAIEGRDGYSYDGYKLKVEFPREKRSDDAPGRFDRSRGFRNSRSPGPKSFPSRNEIGQPRFNRAGGPSKRTDFRVIIENLPRTGSWQDIKDHMREAGDVSFADVFRGGPDDGFGVVEFANEDDMKYALKNLDDTKFKSHQGESSYIKLRDDPDNEFAGKSSRGFQQSRAGGGVGRGGPPPRRDSYRDDYKSSRRSRSPPRGHRGRDSPDYNRGGYRARSRSYSR